MPQAIGVGMLGYAFMGKAHSRALRAAAGARPAAPAGARLDLRPQPRGARGGRGAASAGPSAVDRLARTGRATTGSSSSSTAARTRSTPSRRSPALAAGKHVLCEKPLGLNADESLPRCGRRPSSAGVGARLRLQLPLRARDPPGARAARGRRASARSSTSARATCSRGAGTPTRASGASTARRRRPARSATSARTSSTSRRFLVGEIETRLRVGAHLRARARGRRRVHRLDRARRTARSARSRPRASRAGASTSPPSRSTAPPGSIAFDLRAVRRAARSPTAGRSAIERVSGRLVAARPSDRLGRHLHARVRATCSRRSRARREVAPYGATFEDGYRAAEVCDAILRSSESGREREDRVPMKTSLGIWALGPMVDALHARAATSRECAGETTADEGARGPSTGLGDLIDGYEFHYPQELSPDNLDAVRDGARRARHLLHRERACTSTRSSAAAGSRRPTTGARRGAAAHARGGRLRGRARRALHHLAGDRGLQLPVPDALRGVVGAVRRRRSARPRSARKERGVTIFLEHKNSEPAMKILMRNIGMTLHVIHTLRRQGLDNVKVNMDWQHLIMNGENLGEYAAMLAAEGLLGHQHANSGWGTFDDDNMVGATAFMETLELALELRRAGYGDERRAARLRPLPVHRGRGRGRQAVGAAAGGSSTGSRRRSTRRRCARRRRRRTRCAPTSSCTPRSASD